MATYETGSKTELLKPLGAKIGPPVSLAVVPSKAMVLQLFITCLLLSPLCVGVSCWVLILLSSTLLPFLVYNHSAGKERAGCFAYSSLFFIYRPVSLSVVCDSDIFWSYSYTFVSIR